MNEVGEKSKNKPCYNGISGLAWFKGLTYSTEKL